MKSMVFFYANPELLALIFIGAIVLIIAIVYALVKLIEVTTRKVNPTVASDVIAWTNTPMSWTYLNYD